MITSDHNIIKTVIEVDDRNEDMMADRRNEYDSKQLKSIQMIRGKEERF
jgi:hypothetical protein